MQTSARDKWLTARQRELLPVDYYHLVFSVPHALVPLIWQNKKVLFRLLFEASAKTLLEVLNRQSGIALIVKASCGSWSF